MQYNFQRKELETKRICILDSFQNNKTPGSDGIPIEFYKRCWPLIEEPFINCINECFEKGELAGSQKQAVITLIEKKKAKTDSS